MRDAKIKEGECLPGNSVNRGAASLLPHFRGSQLCTPLCHAATDSVNILGVAAEPFRLRMEVHGPPDNEQSFRIVHRRLCLQMTTATVYVSAT
eukprot:3165271-Pyramimonas_sp.AAC.1